MRHEVMSVLKDRVYTRKIITPPYVKHMGGRMHAGGARFRRYVKTYGGRMHARGARFWRYVKTYGGPHARKRCKILAIR
jgi:hypothetical protein